MNDNTILCQAIHNEFRVCCGLPKGHITDHVGMIGKVPVVWAKTEKDQASIAVATVYFLTGMLAMGSLLFFVWLAIALAG